jgi:release factor glutamine methyltransferase
MIVRDAIEAATDALGAAGCSTPRLDAELLIADALEVTRERLFLDPDMEVPPPAARVIAERVRRRNEREPVAYILGRKGFRNIELMVDRRVTASEVSQDAVDVARENAARLGLPLEVEMVDGLPPGDYDLVIANLPYVRDDQWDGLMPEINRYEPRVALTSGADGLTAIRELIESIPSGTRVVLEHAHDQAAEVRELLDEPVSYPDLASWDRITVGRVP